MPVDALLEHPQLVTHHHDLVKEHLDGHALVGDPLFAGLEHQLAAPPAGADLGVARAQLFA
ncbi:MAG TPA: hypothetical protein VFS43_42840 [Polyangiaceae bacterium]|nr:hypothetical protein [Polyangiaceae bacterium]